MADNGGGFLSNLAGAVKQEEKIIKTPQMAHWEDFWRIVWQTIGLVIMRMLQLLALIVFIGAWGYVVYQFSDAESVHYANQLFTFVNVFFALLFLSVGSVIAWQLTEALEGGLLWSIITLIGVIEIVLCLKGAEVVSWAFMNLIGFGVTPIRQMVLAGYLPLIATIIAAAVVPDFQIGRFAFRHELINQPEASSEKYVVDRTAVALKQMDIDAKHDEMIDAERAEYEDQIASLQEEVARWKSIKPTHRIVPQNHGSAHALDAMDYTDQQWASLTEFVNGWDTRGTARDSWTTKEAEEKYGSRISEPDWDKITADLMTIGMLDARRHPKIKADEAAKMIGL